MVNICGKVEDVLPRILKDVSGEDIFLTMDPPRKGVDRETLNAVLKSGIKKIAMISCNPATMARDVGILTGALIEQNGELKKCGDYGEEGFYQIETVQPFDMFPQTKHVETLVCLEKK